MHEPSHDTPPALLIGLLAPGAPEMSITHVQQRLRSDPRLRGSTVVPSAAVPTQGRWALEILGAPDEPTRRVLVWLEPTARERLTEHLAGHRVDPAEVEQARHSEWSLLAQTQLGDSPLTHFHWLTKILSAACPDPWLVIDVNAFRAWPGAWLSEVASTAVPPHPTALFTVHAVGDGEGPRWLHTHGLDRCGSIELELLDVPHADCGHMCELLNTASLMLIEQGLPPAEEAFLVGKDLALCWLPWESALKKVAAKGPGRAADDRFAPHDGASGVLLVPRKGWFGRTRYENPTCYLDVLKGDPLLYFSNMETERAALLARERLPRFVALLQQWDGDPEKAAFHVKLGCDTSDGSREHIWFLVHEVRANQVVATCLNQPYAVPGLSKGARGEHSLDLLSGWSIGTPLGTFRPDDVGRLEAAWSDSPSSSRSERAD